MTKNGLFLLSIGCLLIAMSPTMQQPVFLLTSGVGLIVLALLFCRKKKESAKRTGGKK